MGTYYWFVDYTNKRYIDGYAAKSAEWRGSQFDQAMVVNYLMDKDQIEVKFAADESGEWDEILEQKFEDYTCDNIYDMFEQGYFREYNSPIWLGNIIWILDKFIKENKLDLYFKIAKQIPEFMETYKETICNNLSKEPVGSN